MFGYVRLFEDEIKVKDLKRYRLYYCELCKEMDNFSKISRLFLSYDITFLTMLIEGDFNPKKCKTHKLKFINCMEEGHGNKKVIAMAAFSIILIYYKLQNDVIDGENIKKIAMKSIETGFKKAKMQFPDVEKIVKKYMLRLYKLEQAKCKNFDKLDDCFSQIFYEITSKFCKGDEFCLIRSNIAKHMAAWVYWIDMYEDLDKDKKNGNFNAIALVDEEYGKKYVSELISRHVYAMSELLEILPYDSCTELLDNIINCSVILQTENKGIKLS